METQTEIFFYRQNENHGYMSNFYKCNFVDNIGNNFNCSEQYFMYMKCLTFDPTNKVLLINILNETNPGKVKYYGRQVKNFYCDLWNTKRSDVMMDALYYKFSQNNDIRKKLIQTGDKLLYEAAKNDKIWGIGFYSNEALSIDRLYYGKNLLGECLMMTRRKFREDNNISSI